MRSLILLAVHYKFILKPQFISGYIPGEAKKLPVFNFSPLKPLGHSQNSHVPMSASEIVKVALQCRTPTVLTLLGTTKTTELCHLCQRRK